MCIIDQNDLVEANTSEEAEQLFQLGRAHDINILSDSPETIPVSLRGRDHDRNIAKSYYQQAAALGHTGAMNNLAVYLQNGFGNKENRFEEDHAGAYALNVEMARRSDMRGYVGMASYHYTNLVNAHDPAKAVACLKVASRADYLPAIVMLGTDDLGVLPANIGAHDQRRTPRGGALLEEAGRRGSADAFVQLMRHYTYINEDWDKQFYYALEAMDLGSRAALTHVEGVFQNGSYGADDPDYLSCIQSKRYENVSRINKACLPQTARKLRGQIGLSPAPTDPLDISTFLDNFTQQNPDL